MPPPPRHAIAPPGENNTYQWLSARLWLHFKIVYHIDKYCSKRILVPCTLFRLIPYAVIRSLLSSAFWNVLSYSVVRPILLVILKNVPPYSVISHSSVIWNSVVSRQGLASHRWLYNLSREWTTFNWASHNHNIAVLLRYVSAIRNWQIFWCGSRPASACRSGGRHLGKFAWGSNLP